jgi:hypothetical protein
MMLLWPDFAGRIESTEREAIGRGTGHFR